LPTLRAKVEMDWSAWREKQFECAQHIGRHANAGIGHRDLHVVTRDTIVLVGQSACDRKRSAVAIFKVPLSGIASR
jgi:hypothetical protein